MSLNLADYKRIRTPFVFFDETGSINDKVNRFFGLGMIKCMQPYYLDAKIRKLRQVNRFYDEIKWNTISRTKIKIIKNIIKDVFNTPGINYSCIIINKATINFEKEFENNPYKAYEEFTKELLRSNIKDNEVLTVLADYMTVPQNIKFEIDIKHSINKELNRLAISGVHRIDSKGTNLIQITDLLLGAVIYDYKFASKLVSGDKNKIEIMNFIKKNINIKSFVGGIKQKSFRVFEYKKKGHHPNG